MHTPNIQNHVDLIREVFNYTERFKGSTFVIKISNKIIDHPDFPQHAMDLALLNKVGIQTIIVPSARNRIDEILERFNVQKRFNKGIRISDQDSIDFIKMAAFDVAHRVMTALSGHQITALIGNWIRARTRGVIDGVDFLHTGLVDKVDVQAIKRTLEQGSVAILPCVGHNAVGSPFNLSSDEITVSIAIALNAKKIFHLEADPVMRTPEWKIPEKLKTLDDGRIFRLTPSTTQELLALNPTKPDKELLENAAWACESGIERVHILDGRQPGVLLEEIFSTLGVGTMLFANTDERIRPMKSSDVPGILEIMKPMVAEGILIARTREELERKYQDYWVYAMDGLAHGCVALHIMEESTAEIANVAVDPRYTQLGIGVKLITCILEEAMEKGIKRVFVLTTRTADWFLAQGFQEGSIADLPLKKLAQYNKERNSRILVKNLMEP